LNDRLCECFTEHRTNIVNRDYRQGNPYAQQDDFYSSGPYQPQTGYSQAGGYSTIPAGNGGGYGASGGAYGGNYQNGNEYEMNNYNSTPQAGGSLSDFFAEVYYLKFRLMC
jgi:hypothetical protein